MELRPEEHDSLPPKRGLQWLLATPAGNRWLLLLPPLFVLLGMLVLRFGLALLPNCMFYEATGLHCPGCGGVRATLSLLRGDILAALYYNPMVVLLYAALAVGYLFFAWNALLRHDYKPPFDLFSPQWGFGVLGVVMLFWVIRNLPFYTTIFY